MHLLLLFLTFITLSSPFTIGKPSYYNPSVSDDLDKFSEVNAEIFRDNTFDFQDSSNTSTLISVNPDITQILSVISIETSSIAISPDGKTLILYDKDLQGFQVYDVSDPEFPSLLNSFTLDFTFSSNLATLVFSPNGKTGFITCNDWIGTEYLMVMDLSNPASPKKIVTQTLYQNLKADLIIQNSGSLIISPDGQTVFAWNCVTTLYESIGSILAIIDVSNITNPREISQFLYSAGTCSDLSTTSIVLQGNKLFYNDGLSLLVLDVSNLTNPILENTINLSTNASVGLAVSADGKNAFTVSEDYDAEPNEITKLQIVNMINPSATINITLGFFPASSLSQTLTLSSNNDFLFVAGFDLMFVNISDMQNITYGAVNTISNPNIITLSPDGRTAFVANNFEVAIIKLYLDVQMNQAFSLPADSNMQLILFPTNDATDDVVQTMAMSSDNNIAFLLLWSGNLQIFDISNLSSPKFLGMISGLNLRDYVSIILSADDQTAFVTCDDKLLIIDISNPASPSILNTYSPEEGGSIVHFDISPDGQVGFLTQQHNLTTINISHPESLVNIEILEVKNILVALSFGLSKDGNLGFVLIQNISSQVYSLLSLDTSNVSSLSEINLLSLTSSNNLSNKKTTIAGESDTHISISPDNEAVFITLDINGVDLQVCDFSNLASPTQIFWSVSISPILPIIFSQDSTTAFICTSTEFLVVNISPLDTPTILRSYPVSNAVSIMLSQDESIAYLSIQNGTLLIISLQPEYALDIWKSNYDLGGVYSNPIVPLQLNAGNKYNVMNQKLSFLEVSFYSIETLPGTGQTIITYPPLPSWISFEQDQGILTISPVSEFQMGYYQIYGALSTIISSDVFIGLGNITNLTQSQDLFATLISLGYISPQGFLTSNFDSSANLVLFSQYSDLEYDIHAKLLNYYIEITTTVSVGSSLSLMLSKEFMVVNTKSQNTLSLVIQVNSSFAQFISANYAAVTMVSNNDSTISIEGSLANINLALGQIILNLNDDITECDGSMAIYDGLNPSMNQSIANISQYFILNRAPVLNPDISIQGQLSSIYTGEEFFVDLTRSFLDSNGQILEYSLSMKDDTAQVPEWLMIRGQTLGGTPPKQISHSEIDLVIIAKNQFKSSSIPVTLKIRISVVYGLELVGTYGGALITIIGLYIYLGTIYNILCKKRYRYPKDFVIKVGDERSVHDICCIGFIGKEVRASKAILQEIRKAVARELNIKSVSNEKLLDYFMDPISDSLIEEKLVQMAKRELLNLEEKNKFRHDKHSPIKGHLRKDVIQQLVINEVLAMQVDLDKEKITRNVFKALRNDWVHLVERTSDPLQYKLNKKELKKRMMRIRVGDSKVKLRDRDNNKDDRDSNENLMLNPQLSTSDDFITMDKNVSKEISMTPLVEPNQMKVRGDDNVNYDLLERLLIDVAFRYHNLNVDAIHTRVVINQKPWELTSWTRFKGLFKKDLLQVEFAPRGETGYGISYEVRNGVLRFYGAPEKELKDTTLVIQIMNKRGRILRELWINCIADELERIV